MKETQSPHPATRYLGLELSGAKNQKTSIAAIEYYSKERKTFLLDIFDRITSLEEESGDEALLDVIQEINSGVVKMGVNVPLELPPCVTCTRKTCPLPSNCTVPSVKWMREFSRKAPKKSKKNLASFTPYTQRPIELWIRHSALTELPESHHFEIDETLGGNRAPLTARMHFLKRHLQTIPLVEVSPKLTVATLAAQLDIQKRFISTYRQLDEGAHSREIILTAFSQRFEIFIYERDMRKLSQNLTAFDAFICAFTALLSDRNFNTQIPKGFPIASGWIEYPQVDV